MENDIYSFKKKEAILTIKERTKTYKTVRVIKEDGLGAEIDFGYRIRQFKCKNGCEHHNHLVCSLCGTYIYLDNEPLENLQDNFVKANGFVPKKIDFKIYGVCKNCL